MGRLTQEGDSVVEMQKVHRIGARAGRLNRSVRGSVSLIDTDVPLEQSLPVLIVQGRKDIAWEGKQITIGPTRAQHVRCGYHLEAKRLSNGRERLLIKLFLK